MKTCVDCGTELRHGAGTRVMVHMDKFDGGYDRVEMPACRHCALKRRGYECEECGQLHETQHDAYECCVGTRKAPDCIECGRRMAVGAAGYHPGRGPDITWAECECCPIGWGRFTGWELLDGEEPCKHVEGDDGDQRVITDGGKVEDDMVYIPAQGNGNGSPVMHTDLNCSRLQNARKVHKYPRENVDKDLCCYCAGEPNHGSGDPRGPWQDLKSADPGDLITDGGQGTSRDDADGMTVHLPPQYDLQGNRQVWFIETGRQPFDDLVNGALFALSLAVVFYVLAYAGGAF